MVWFYPWDELAGINADMSFYIDAKSTDLDDEYLPPLRPDIRNNHLDYMLTWYSFAIILMNSSQGRQIKIS